MIPLKVCNVGTWIQALFFAVWVFSVCSVNAYVLFVDLFLFGLFGVSLMLWCKYFMGDFVWVHFSFLLLLVIGFVEFD